MSLFWHLSVSLGVGVAWFIVFRGRSSLSQTTLCSAWNWSLVGSSAWALTWLFDSCGKWISAAAADYAWYACSVLALCPPIAVLGSRRPGTKVWTWFILFPMLLALCWPIIALRLQGSELRGLHLETPQLVAFGLVLVMGVGNYCGTRHTLSALIYGAATLTIVVSCSTISPRLLADRSVTRFWATAAMALAIGMLTRSTRPVVSTRFDRLWFDFFDTFGIVWGRRIQDRVNFVANKEGWPVRLELEGFIALDQRKPTPSHSTRINEGISDQQRAQDRPSVHELEIESRVEQALRWLLRRFVDPSWIDHRLQSRCPQNSTEISVDS